MRVGRVRRATPSSVIVQLELSGAEFPYKPGQLAMVGPATAVGLVPYSIASAPEESAREGFIEFLAKTDASGRWGAHFEPLRRGARLSVQGPSGSFVFPDRPKERAVLFIAGGTGIAPLRSMIRHALQTGFEGALNLLYSARTPKDFAYLPELRAMAKQQQINLSLTTTREFTPRWRGGRGRIAAGQLASFVSDPRTLCFVCGPATMVADVPPMLRALGIERTRIRLEDW